LTPNPRQGDPRDERDRRKGQQAAPLDTLADLTSSAAEGISSARPILLSGLFPRDLKTKNFHLHSLGRYLGNYGTYRLRGDASLIADFCRLRADDTGRSESARFCA
jgi:hypothetical protein